MAIEEKPRLGSWYETDEGQLFQVTAFDENKGVLDVRYPQGSVDEIDLAIWYEMEITEVEAPENWRGLIDPTR